MTSFIGIKTLRSVGRPGLRRGIAAGGAHDGDYRQSGEFPGRQLASSDGSGLYICGLAAGGVLFAPALLRQRNSGRLGERMMPAANSVVIHSTPKRQKESFHTP